jgi:hypothetical protein
VSLTLLTLLVIPAVCVVWHTESLIREHGVRLVVAATSYRRRFDALRESSFNGILAQCPTPCPRSNGQ